MVDQRNMQHLDFITHLPFTPSHLSRREELAASALLLLATQESSTISQLRPIWLPWKNSGQKKNEKERIGCVKSVPLSCKLQPCIFNFLSTYNVIHWRPSQTRAGSLCCAREQTVLFCAVKNMMKCTHSLCQAEKFRACRSTLKQKGLLEMKETAGCD